MVLITVTKHPKIPILQAITIGTRKLAASLPTYTFSSFVAITESSRDQTALYKTRQFQRSQGVTSRLAGERDTEQKVESATDLHTLTTNTTGDHTNTIIGGMWRVAIVN